MGSNIDQNVVDKNLSKIELIDILHEKLGLKIKVANKCIDKIFNEISDELSKGNSVRLSGFGSFFPTEKKARIGRDPVTKKTVMIYAKKAVSFKCSDILKDILNES